MKISIITINYNNLAGLKKTVESVVNQTYDNIEYIIIDGNSTDGGSEYIKNMQEYFDYWVSEPDKGIYNALNKGIKASTGSYLLFMNSGDILLSDNTIEKFVKLDPKIDVYYSDIYWDFSNGDDLEIWRLPQELSLSHMYNSSIPHQGSIFSKRFFAEYGPYDESMIIVSDWAKCFEFFLDNSKSFRKLDFILSVYDKTGLSSDVSNYLIYAKERRQVLDNYFSADVQFEIEKLFYIEGEYYRIIQFYKRIGIHQFVSYLRKIRRNLNNLRKRYFQK